MENLENIFSPVDEDDENDMEEDEHNAEEQVIDDAMDSDDSSNVDEYSDSSDLDRELDNQQKSQNDFEEVMEHDFDPPIQLNENFLNNEQHYETVNDFEEEEMESESDEPIFPNEDLPQSKFCDENVPSEGFTYVEESNFTFRRFLNGKYQLQVFADDDRTNCVVN
uniref:Uncharacterized protein n=1 Tax=Panagrolaimus superbus TaxID=310955 RepID=A0A914Z4I8_9BILA